VPAPTVGAKRLLRAIDSERDLVIAELRPRVCIDDGFDQLPLLDLCTRVTDPRGFRLGVHTVTGVPTYGSPFLDQEWPVMALRVAMGSSEDLRECLPSLVGAAPAVVAVGAEDLGGSRHTHFFAPPCAPP
jgi:hypothetical protein